MNAYHVKMNQGNSVKQQQYEFGFLQNLFEKANFVGHFCGKSGKSGNSHDFVNNNKTQNFDTY